MVVKAYGIHESVVPSCTLKLDLNVVRCRMSDYIGGGYGDLSGILRCQVVPSVSLYVVDSSRPVGAPG